MRRFLCKIGLHRYRLVGFRGLMLADWLEECDGCGKGRLLISHGQAVAYYSPDEMQAIRASHCNPSAPPRSSPARLW